MRRPGRGGHVSHSDRWLAPPAHVRGASGTRQLTIAVVGGMQKCYVTRLVFRAFRSFAEVR